MSPRCPGSTASTTERPCCARSTTPRTYSGARRTATLADAVVKAELPAALPDGNLVDERVALDGQDDVGGLDRPLLGVVDPGDGQYGRAWADLEPARLDGESRAGRHGFLGVRDLLADDGHALDDAAPGVRSFLGEHHRRPFRQVGGLPAH